MAEEPDLNVEGDVQVGVRTTLVEHLMSLSRNIWALEFNIKRISSISVIDA